MQQRIAIALGTLLALAAIRAHADGTGWATATLTYDGAAIGNLDGGAARSSTYVGNAHLRSLLDLDDGSRLVGTMFGLFREHDDDLVRVPLREGRTLHHDVYGRHGAGKVYLRAAPAGTGVIAGGPMRAVFETLGLQDVVAKSVGSSNPYNVVRATFDALKHQDSPRTVAARRNIKVSTLQSRRRDGDAEQVAE